MRSLPEERAAELAARTLAFPDARRAGMSRAADLGGGALSSGQLPLPDCVGQVGHPLRRLRADLLKLAYPVIEPGSWVMEYKMPLTIKQRAGCPARTQATI